MFVGPDTRENDVILLTALEGVYTCNLNFLIKNRYTISEPDKNAPVSNI